MLKTMQEFHILMQVVRIIQEHQQWTQMLKFGKELTSIMEKLMVIRKEIMMKMTSRNTEMTKRLRQTPDFHTLQPFFKQIMHQQRLQKINQVYHM